MKTSDHASHPVITQSQNNATMWIGHSTNDPTDHFAGQTFKCPSPGLLDNIQVYTSAVQMPGEMLLTLHEFEPESKSWGPAIGESNLSIQKKDISKWITFELEPVALKKDGTYGFRIQTIDAYIGIGEAATGNQQPFTFGNAWSGDSKNKEGHFFTYFSLTFKVEMKN